MILHKLTVILFLFLVFFFFGFLGKAPQERKRMVDNFFFLALILDKVW